LDKLNMSKITIFLLIRDFKNIENVQPEFIKLW